MHSGRMVSSGVATIVSAVLITRGPGPLGPQRAYLFLFLCIFFFCEKSLAVLRASKQMFRRGHAKARYVSDRLINLLEF